jgi:hypothetical protein
MSKQIIAKEIRPSIKRFTLDAVSKYSYKGVKTLTELMSLFPNFGMGFRLWRKSNRDEYFILDKISVKNNRNAEFFGILHRNGEATKRVERIRTTQQDLGWNFEPLTTKCYTDNGVEYDIKKYEELIAQKKKIIERRNKILEFQNPLVAQKEEIKKKKAEAASVKPKKR